MKILYNLYKINLILFLIIKKALHKCLHNKYIFSETIKLFAVALLS